MESSSSVITPEDVMGTLMNDGTIDSMRLKIITQLKANVCFALSPQFTYFLFKHMFSYKCLSKILSW